MRNKHLATFTQNLIVIETLVFFPLIYFVGAPVFLPQHWKLLGPERLMPLKLLGVNRVKHLPKYFSNPKIQPPLCYYYRHSTIRLTDGNCTGSQPPLTSPDMMGSAPMALLMAATSAVGPARSEVPVSAIAAQPPLQNCCGCSPPTVTLKQTMANIKCA